MPHVIIIGAGPAGSLAALLLRRRGVGVTLVEQHRFPRDKVCGECISALGLDVLRRAGLLDRLSAAGAVEMTRACLHAPNGAMVSLALPKPMWGLSRRTMDLLLLEAAVEAGATLRQPARCESIEAGPCVVIHDLETNASERLSTDCVVLADGKAALIEPRPLATSDLGIKAHFADLAAPRDAVELFGVRGHYGGVAPIEGGLWNVAFSVPRRRIEECPDLDGLFARIISENRSLARHFASGRRVGGWLASPLPRFGVGKTWPAGVIPIGNAAAALEPIGGEGMGLAMRSAELAADALLAGRPVQLPKQFAQLWNRRRATCRTAAIVLSRPWLFATAAKMLEAMPALGPTALAWIGKMESDSNAAQSHP